MRMELKAPQIWIASEAVDFRKAANGLMEIVRSHFQREDDMSDDHNEDEAIYVFYDRTKSKLKLLARHRNGVVLIYKRLDKNRFTLKTNAQGNGQANESARYEITEQQLTWLLAGLDWVNMSEWKELSYQDYY